MSLDFQINKNWAGLLQTKVYINSGTKIHDIAFATQIKNNFSGRSYEKLCTLQEYQIVIL